MVTLTFWLGVLERARRVRRLASEESMADFCVSTEDGLIVGKAEPFDQALRKLIENLKISPNNRPLTQAEKETIKNADSIIIYRPRKPKPSRE
jgi:hypothetical protein